MNENEKLLIFSVSGQRCAFSLATVDRIICAVEIKPLPKAPSIIIGLINVQGRAIPVLDIRMLFQLPEVEMGLNDQIIIAHTASRPIAILIDNATGVAEYGAEDVIQSAELFPGIEHLEGVVKLKDGIAYIYDIDRFLSLEEKAVLDRVLPPGARISEIGEHNA